MAQAHTPDVEGFSRAVDQLRAEVLAQLGPDDLRHLTRVRLLGLLATILGLATGWIAPNPISAFLLGYGRTIRLTVGHHVCHRAYDRVPGVPAHLTSARFGKGWRRFVDWFDWAEIDAWTYTHNQHHAHTNSAEDPDVMAYTYVSQRPRWMRPLVLIGAMATFKAAYYTPRMQLAYAETAPGAAPPRMWQVWRAEVAHVWAVMAPYAIFHFGVLPALFWPLGAWAMFSVLVNSLLGEALTNAMVFIAVGSTHVAPDVPLFDERVRGKSEYYLRCVLAAVDYTGRGDLASGFQVWCNYQVAHHLWPEFTLLRYQQVQPRLEELLRTYGIPYRQEPMFRRFRRSVDLYLGRGEHRPSPNAAALLPAA